MTDFPPEAAEEYAQWLQQQEQEERELREAEEVAEWHFNYGRKVRNESLSGNS
jgi:hypothetical protein